MTFSQIRDGTLRDEYPQPGETPVAVLSRPPSFGGEAILSANELHWLRFVHASIAAANLPPREMRTKMDELEQEFTRYEHLPTRSIAAVMLSVYSQAITKQTQGEAQKAVVCAAAAVMAYKQRHGKFPGKLKQAMPTVPTDPFQRAGIALSARG